MKLAQSVKMGAWLLILLNLLMAFGSIWIFMRMAPAIEVIISQNRESFKASEQMLAALATAAIPGEKKEAVSRFEDGFNRVKDYARDLEEPAVVAKIGQNYKAAFNGDADALRQTAAALVKLGEINREVTRRADLQAKQLGYAGAWGVVFMAAGTFLVGMLFLRALKRNLAGPIEEIDATVRAVHSGEFMRRCTMKNPPRSIRRIYGNINELLDRYSSVLSRSR